MATPTLQSWSRQAWTLARRQHWVVSRGQLLGLGMSPATIRHRLRIARLHPVMRGIYVVGRPQLSVHGRWMAAVLACGPQARLSHRSAAALYGVCRLTEGPVEVVVPIHVARRRPGVRVHRCLQLTSMPPSEAADIPVTDIFSTFFDLALCVSAMELERAVNEADQRDLIDADQLSTAIAESPGRAGVAPLRRLLAPHAFVATDSVLEQRFLPLARAAGLGPPQTQVWLNGYRVDFYWPQLGLIVETDGLRYHRTPATQAADHRRDNAHTAAGFTSLRFSHWEVLQRPDRVRGSLATTARRLAGGLRLNDRGGPDDHNPSNVPMVAD